MALYSEIFCEECNETKGLYHDPMVVPKVCYDCVSETEQVAKDKWLESREQSSLSDRLSFIEEALYNIGYR